MKVVQYYILHFACNEGLTEVVELLLTCDEVDVNAQNMCVVTHH